MELLLIAEFSLSEVFVSRDYRIEVEDVLVGSFQVGKKVVDVHVANWLVGAVLGLVRFATGGELELVHYGFSNLGGANKDLLGVVLRLGMLWEVFGIFFLDCII